MYTPIHNHYFYTHTHTSMGSFWYVGAQSFHRVVSSPGNSPPQLWCRAVCHTIWSSLHQHRRCLVCRWQGKCEFWVTALFLSQKRVGGWNQLPNKNTSCCIWETSKLVKNWTLIIPRNIFLSYSQKNIVCDAWKSPRTHNSKNGTKPEKSLWFWECFSNQWQNK